MAAQKKGKGSSFTKKKTSPKITKAGPSTKKKATRKNTKDTPSATTFDFSMTAEHDATVSHIFYSTF